MPSSERTPPKKPVTWGTTPVGGEASVSSPVCVFLANTACPELKATTRPSGVMLVPRQLPPAVSCAPLLWVVTRVMAPVARFFRNRSATRLLSPATRLVASLEKSTRLPSADAEQVVLLTLAALPLVAVETSSMLPTTAAAPSCAAVAPAARASSSAPLTFLRRSRLEVLSTMLALLFDGTIARPHCNSGGWPSPHGAVRSA